MVAFFYTGLLAMVLLAGCSEWSHDDSRLKIVNGSIVDGGSLIAKQTVALTRIEEDTRVAFCTGTVIDSNWVLTAAHCVNQMNGFGVDVSFGLGHLSESEVVTIKGTASVHPDPEDHDIALLKLEKNVPEFASPATLAKEDVVPGSEVILAGYGLTYEKELNYLEKRIDAVTMSEALQLTDDDIAPEIESGKLPADTLQRRDELQRKRQQLEQKIVNLPLSVDPSLEADLFGKVKAIETELQSLSNTLKSAIRRKGKELTKLEQRQKTVKRLLGTNGAAKKTLRQTTTTVEQVTDDNLILFKSANGVNTACGRDSGGPMYLERDHQLIQVGIAIKTGIEPYQCGDGSGTHLNVARYLEFIHKITSQAR